MKRRASYLRNRRNPHLSLEEDEGGPDFGIAPGRVGMGEEIGLGLLERRGGVADGLQRPALVEGAHEFFCPLVIDIPEGDKDVFCAGHVKGARQAFEPLGIVKDALAGPAHEAAVGA